MGKPKADKSIANNNPIKKSSNNISKSPLTNKKPKPSIKKKNLSFNDVIDVVHHEIENQVVNEKPIEKLSQYSLTLQDENTINKIIDMTLNVSETIHQKLITESVISEEIIPNENIIPKTFIIDTSVILNDVNNIFILSQNNTNKLVIPETVLDEIDNKKSGFTDINFQAREFNRLIDNSVVINRSVINKKNTPKIIKNDDELRIITIKLASGTILDLVSKNNYNVNVTNEVISIVNDRKILEIAMSIRVLQHLDLPLIVVSNDIALRTRALSCNLDAQPLMKNRKSEVEDINLIEVIKIQSKDKGIIETRDCTPELYGRKFSNFTNIVFECEDTGEQILTFYKFNKFHILNEKFLRSFAVKPKNKEQLFFMNLLLDKDVSIVVCSGVTGSGKNLLSLAGGLQFINSHESTSKINSGLKYCRNTVTAGDEVAQLGFLKGDENQKLSVFSYPLIDSINTYIETIQNTQRNNKNSIPVITPKEFMENNSIEVININQMRGSNLHGFIILDEWQSSSNSVNKLMLTRVVDGSKIVILGDLNQIDNPHLSKFDNALTSMLKHAQTSDLVGGIKLTKVQRGKIADFAEKNL